MASSHASPADLLRVDCLAVLLGAQRGIDWASAPSRKFARAWGPLAHTLEGDTSRVAWMPAHCSEDQAYTRCLSNGQALTAADICINALVDGLAKEVARRQKPPQWQIDMVRAEGRKVADAAMWIGRATAFANRFPNPHWTEQLGPKLKFLRDSEGTRPRRPASTSAKRKLPAPESEPVQPGNLSPCPRWEAVRLRVLAKASRTS